MTTKAHMGFSTQSKAVVVCRVGPQHPQFANACQCSDEYVKKGWSVELFFHGPSLGDVLQEAQASSASIPQSQLLSVRVCQAAWQRLGQPPLPRGWMVGGLVSLWDEIARASACHTFGHGVWPDDWPPAKTGDWGEAPKRFGVMVSYQPDEADRDSILECILAAATLEFDLVVAWVGKGQQEQFGPGALRWAQLSDQSLARVVHSAEACPDCSDRRWWVC